MKNNLKEPCNDCPFRPKGDTMVEVRCGDGYLIMRPYSGNVIKVTCTSAFEGT